MQERWINAEMKWNERNINNKNAVSNDKDSHNVDSCSIHRYVQVSSRPAFRGVIEIVLIHKNSEPHFKNNKTPDPCTVVPLSCSMML
jgi:hypothetical protein